MGGTTYRGLWFSVKTLRLLGARNTLLHHCAFDHIRCTVIYKQDLQVLESFLIFNKYAFSVARRACATDVMRHADANGSARKE
jgi:hypothetical protein